jgi:hypothetical protein
VTFKVGDSVRHESRGRAEVTYGPYENTFGQSVVVVRLESGRETSVSVGMLTAASKFAIGDNVRTPLTGIRGPIVAGPFIATGDGERYWIVEQPNGRHSTPREDGLTKEAACEIKVGDRVRVTDADGESKFVGRIAVVKRLDEGAELAYLVEFGNGSGRHGDDNGRWWCRAVEPVSADTFEHAGVTYALDAEYRDKDGDTWRFSTEATGNDGSPIGIMNDDGLRESLIRVVRDYSPLRKL